MTITNNDPFDEMLKELSDPTKTTFSLDKEEDLFSDFQDDEDEKKLSKEKEEDEEETEEVEETTEEDEEEEEEKVIPKKKTEKVDTTKVKEKEDETEFGEYEADIAKFVSTKLSEKLGEDLGEFDNVSSIIDKLAEIVEESSTPEFANEDIAQLDKFVREGGDLRKFYADTIESSIDVKELDLDEVSDQKRVIRQNLKNSGLTDSQIKRKIERYEELEVLKEEAEEAAELVEEYDKKNKEKLLKGQEKIHREAESRQQNFISNVQTVIKDIKDIAGIPLTDKERREILAYTLAVGKDGKTAYQRDYDKDLEKNFIISAFFTKNKTTLLGKAEKIGASKLAKELQEKFALKGKRTKKSISQTDDHEVDALEMFSKQLRRN
jgi:hypothetical protein